MDVNASGHILTSNDCIVHYIAVKGFLHAWDCAVFGLKDNEAKALLSRCTGTAWVQNNFKHWRDRNNLDHAARNLSLYCTDIYKKMERKDDCDHSDCAGAASSNLSVMQTFSEMDWDRGIWSAAFYGDIDKVRLLIDKAENSEDVVKALDNNGYTALHYAARNGFVDICQLLIQRGADIDALTRSGRATPLHKAAASGKIETVKFLIEFGAQADAQDVDGETALHKAFLDMETKLVNYLLQVCPKLQNITDYKGRYPNDI